MGSLVQSFRSQLPPTVFTSGSEAGLRFRCERVLSPRSCEKVGGSMLTKGCRGGLSSPALCALLYPSSPIRRREPGSDLGSSVPTTTAVTGA